MCLYLAMCSGRVSDGAIDDISKMSAVVCQSVYSHIFLTGQEK